MNLSKKNILVNLDRTLVLSPLSLIFLIVFNVPDSKFLFSRLTILVSLYCAFRFRRCWSVEFKNKYKLVLLGAMFIVYFFLMQYLNDGNSDLPRSLLYLMLYFLFVPLRLITTNFFFVIASLGCILSGLSSLYEFYVLGAERVGFMVSNPIPFSFYSGVCLVSSCFLFYFKWYNNKCYFFDYVLVSLASILSIVAIVLSQTRATFLSLLLVMSFLSALYLLRKPSVKRFLVIFMSFCMFLTLSWSVPDVKNRVSDAWDQVSLYSQNNYYSSTGIRVKLWISGIEIFGESFISGHSKDEIKFIANQKIKDGLFPDFLRPFLDHPNPNFHNQFIQSLADSGLIGFILICLFVSAPVLLLINKYCKKHRLFGVSLTIITMTCLWFDSLFLYNQTVILYGALVILLFSFSQESLEEDK